MSIMIRLFEYFNIISACSTHTSRYKYSCTALSQARQAYREYIRTVADLFLRDANLTMDDTTKRQTIDQFVEDAFGQETKLARVRDSKLARVRESKLAPVRESKLVRVRESKLPRVR